MIGSLVCGGNLVSDVIKRLICDILVMADGYL